MRLGEAISHVLFTGLISIFVFAILTIGNSPNEIYYIFTFLLGGIFRMIIILITEEFK